MKMARSNLQVERAAQQHRRWLPWALRAWAAAHLERAAHLRRGMRTMLWL